MRIVFGAERGADDTRARRADLVAMDDLAGRLDPWDELQAAGRETGTALELRHEIRDRAQVAGVVDLADRDTEDMRSDDRLEILLDPAGRERIDARAHERVAAREPRQRGRDGRARVRLLGIGHRVFHVGQDDVGVDVLGFREHAGFVAGGEQKAPHAGHGEARPGGSKVSTILPKWVRASIVLCASATASIGYTAWMMGAICPDAKRGITLRSNAAMIAAFSAIGRSRSTEPRIACRLTRTLPRSSVASRPPIVAMTASRPFTARALRFGARYEAPT